MWLEILKACVPILVALVGIIPTINSSRKKTQQSLESFKTEVKDDITVMKNEISGIKQEMTDLKDDVQKVKAGNASSLYFQIDSACTKAINDGAIDKESYQALKAAWEAYHANGGNGYLNAMMEKVDKLPFSKNYGI